MSEPSEPALALFEALLGARTFEEAVRGAVRHMYEALHAETAGVVVMIHSGVFLEVWHPEERMRPRGQLQALKSFAARVAQSGASGVMPLGENPRQPLVAHAAHLALGHRLKGGVCVVAGEDQDIAAAGFGPLDRLSRLIALRLNDLLQSEAERRKSEQFERWFRVSDRHIRALDLERQKFAALLNSFSGGAFVATRDGQISWQTRPLMERSGNSGDSWVGKSCREFCQALGGSEHPACGECLVQRVLESRQSATQQIALWDGADARMTQAVAAPINDLAGRAQEVIVTLQEPASATWKTAA